MAGGEQFETPFPAEPLRVGSGRVLPDWVDYNGHMNVGYYGLAFDQCLEPWYEDWIDLGPSYVARHNMGPFALQSQLFYIQEQTVGAAFYVCVQLLDCDQKRWHLFMTMHDAETGALTATCEQLSMNVDLEKRRSAPLVEAQARRLEAMRAAQAGLPRPAQAGAVIGIRRA